MSITNLKDTVDLMLSADYKERFKGEYYQVKIRYEKLSDVLEKYENDTLEFTPICSYNLLYSQKCAMSEYLYFLKERAKVEEIDL